MKFVDFEFGNKHYRIYNNGMLIDLAKNEKVIESINEDGYRQVRLGHYKIRKTFGLHRLVAKYFVENPEPEILIEVNHKDFDRKNCNYDNLEWCTHKQNIQYSILHHKMHYQNNDLSGKNNPNYGNRKLSKFYAENKDYAKEKQGRPGIKNGRCIKIAMISADKKFYKEFDYIRACTKYIIENNISSNCPDVISNNISLCARNKKDRYLGYSFCKI